ncbi:type IV secretion system protein [Sphingomonas sp. GM_Shp_2]|uniref:type IV secretion system protein n=1 Tax=Sphingomonas sp. GM_Shp_2 TaxID=2937380 RepID=UPI00226A4326|nr:type IV secretion system protein [Sphingomonas sp. GM_Shp_2]
MATPIDVMSLFTTMYGYVESAIAGAVASFGSGLVAFVAAPLALAATIYFLLLGFAVLRGAIQAPLRELVFQAAKVGFALAAASTVGYTVFVVNIATELPGEIISAGSGTAVANPGTTFDNYVADTGKLASRMAEANGRVQSQTPRGLTDFQTPLIQLECTIITYGCVIILYAFAYLSAAIGFCIVIFAKLAVAICVALAPLALACLLFNSSRWLFDGWLKQSANYILLMVVMAIMTKFITGLQEAAMNSILEAIGDGSAFNTMENTYITLSIGVIVTATLACCAIYIVGSIFFFQSPAIAAGIAGGASSGGHGFLMTGANMMANRLMFRRATQAAAPASRAAGGGSINRAG